MPLWPSVWWVDRSGCSPEWLTVMHGTRNTEANGWYLTKANRIHLSRTFFQWFPGWLTASCLIGNRFCFKCEWWFGWQLATSVKTNSFQKRLSTLSLLNLKAMSKGVFFQDFRPDIWRAPFSNLEIAAWWAEFAIRKPANEARWAHSELMDTVVSLVVELIIDDLSANRPAIVRRVGGLRSR